MESTNSTTFLPWSRKYSATVVASSAALQRSTEEKSEVANTSAQRSRLGEARSASANSVTSRPRSPIRPTTKTSASLCSISMCINMVLPQPAEAKMPTRWPTPQVSRPSMARTPVASGSRMPTRREYGGGSASMPRSSPPTPASGAKRSTMRPDGSSTAPSADSPIQAASARPVGCSSASRDRPRALPIRLSTARSPWKPTAGAGHHFAVLPAAADVAQLAYRHLGQRGFQDGAGQALRISQPAQQARRPHRSSDSLKRSSASK